MFFTLKNKTFVYKKLVQTTYYPYFLCYLFIHIRWFFFVLLFCFSVIKWNYHLWFMQILKIFYCQKLIESKIQLSLIKKIPITCYLQLWLLCVDDNFSIPFKLSLDQDVEYNFINSMVEERKYWCDVMKKHFKK